MMPHHQRLVDSLINRIENIRQELESVKILIDIKRKAGQNTLQDEQNLMKAEADLQAWEDSLRTAQPL